MPDLGRRKELLHALYRRVYERPEEALGAEGPLGDLARLGPPLS